MAKLAASEAAHKAADKAMQILASAGYRRGSVVERLFRDVRATEIYQGTSEAQRMIIAAHIPWRTHQAPRHVDIMVVPPLPSHRKAGPSA